MLVRDCGVDIELLRDIVTGEVLFCGNTFDTNCERSVDASIDNSRAADISSVIIY